MDEIEILSTHDLLCQKFSISLAVHLVGKCFTKLQN